MSATLAPPDNARDPLDANVRLPLAMQRADDDLLAAVGSDLARRWHGDGAGEGNEVL